MDLKDTATITTIEDGKVTKQTVEYAGPAVYSLEDLAKRWSAVNATVDSIISQSQYVPILLIQYKWKGEFYPIAEDEQLEKIMRGEDVVITLPSGETVTVKKDHLCVTSPTVVMMEQDYPELRPANTDATLENLFAKAAAKQMAKTKLVPASEVPVALTLTKVSKQSGKTINELFALADNGLFTLWGRGNFEMKQTADEYFHRDPARKAPQFFAIRAEEITVDCMARIPWEHIIKRNGYYEITDFIVEDAKRRANVDGWKDGEYPPIELTADDLYVMPEDLSKIGVAGQAASSGQRLYFGDVEATGLPEFAKFYKTMSWGKKGYSESNIKAWLGQKDGRDPLPEFQKIVKPGNIAKLQDLYEFGMNREADKEKKL